jgi:hypothetical protein
MLGRAIVSAFLLCLSPMVSAQVPAPPSLPGQDALAERLVRAIESKDVSAYSGLLADELVVTEDGKIAARTKAAWLSQYGKKLAVQGVSFKVAPGYSSTGRLLFIECFNSAGSWGGPVPAHCCWSHDAVAYDIEGGRIIAIHRRRGGDMELDEQGRPLR